MIEDEEYSRKLFNDSKIMINKHILMDKSFENLQEICKRREVSIESISDKSIQLNINKGEIDLQKYQIES
jgi:hypothetical protein